MDLSQHKKAQKTALALMRVSADHTGTIEELMLVESARFVITQTDQIVKLQAELEELRVENSRLRHRRNPSSGAHERFGWTLTELGL